MSSFAISSVRPASPTPIPSPQPRPIPKPSLASYIPSGRQFTIGVLRAGVLMSSYLVGASAQSTTGSQSAPTDCSSSQPGWFSRYENWAMLGGIFTAVGGSTLYVWKNYFSRHVPVPTDDFKSVKVELARSKETTALVAECDTKLRAAATHAKTLNNTKFWATTYPSIVADSLEQHLALAAQSVLILKGSVPRDLDSRSFRLVNAAVERLLDELSYGMIISGKLTVSRWQAAKARWNHEATHLCAFFCCCCRASETKYANLPTKRLEQATDVLEKAVPVEVKVEKVDSPASSERVALAPASSVAESVTLVPAGVPSSRVIVDVSNAAKARDYDDKRRFRRLDTNQTAAAASPTVSVQLESPPQPTVGTLTVGGAATISATALPKTSSDSSSPPPADGSGSKLLSSPPAASPPTPRSNGSGASESSKAAAKRPVRVSGRAAVVTTPPR